MVSSSMLIGHLFSGIISPQSGRVLHVEALTFAKRLHALPVCPLAVHLVQWFGVTTLLAGLGAAPPPSGGGDGDERVGVLPKLS